MNRPKTCIDCKYYDYDVYYDNIDFDEYEVLSCDKGHNDYIDFDAEPCEDFEEE